MKLLDRGGVRFTLDVRRDAEGVEHYDFHLGGEKVEALADTLNAYSDKYVLWGRHLLWRGIVGFLGLLFVQSASLGPWPTVAYAIGMTLAMELAMKLDRRGDHRGDP